MRVIAGTAKGVRLKAVSGSQVRPTTDRVKESLFQIIGPYFDGGNILDLFAGSGSLGLEALSRGAQHAVFVDQKKESVDVIRTNLRSAKLEERSEVYRRDARTALRLLKRQGKVFRYIFLDPPYQDPILSGILGQISVGNMLEPDGIVIVERASDVILEADYHDLKRIRTLHYGDTDVDLYCQKED